MNTLRHPDYIKILHRIRAAEKQTTLDSLQQLIERYCDKHMDGRDLVLEYFKREDELDPFSQNCKITTKPQTHEIRN